MTTTELSRRVTICAFTILAAAVARPADAGPWQAVGPSAGGNVSSIAVDAGNPNVIYAAVQTFSASGLYKSSDGGATWTSASSGITPSGTTGTLVQALVGDPVVPGVVYAGTVDGVFMSSDAGATWARASVAATGISELAVSTVAGSSVLYAGTSAGTLFRTLDRGASWQSIGGNLPPYAVGALVHDPVSGAVYVAFNCSSLTCGIYKSTNGGATWDAVNNGIQRFFAPRINILSLDNITSLARGADGALYAGAFTGVYKSIDAGASWSALPEGGFDIRSVTSMLIDAPPDGTLYVAMSSSNGLSVLKSTNGGASFVDTNLAVGAVALARTGNGRIIVGTDTAGPFTTQDGGTTWTGARSGLPRIAVRSFAIDPSDAATVYGATDGGLFKSTDAGLSWTRGGPAAGGVCAVAIDPVTPTTIYADTVRNEMFKSTDGGGTWTRVRVGFGNGYCGSKKLFVDPNNPRTIYSTEGLYSALNRTTDGGTTWATVGGGGELAFDPTSPQRLFLLSNSELFRSVDAGATFTAVTPPVSTCCSYASSIIVSGDGTVIAGQSSTLDVFRSTDHAASWSRVLARNADLYSGATSVFARAGIATAPIYGVFPAAANGSSSAQVLRSFDNGVTWLPFPEPLPAGVFRPLFLTVTSSGRLYLSTDEGLFATGGDAPAITSVAPASGSVAGGTRVTVTGSNFVSGASVKFGASAATSVVVASATSLSATTPAGSGTVAVTVTNPDSQSATLPAAFTYGCTYSANMPRTQTMAASGRAATRVSINGYVGPATLPGFPVCAGVPVAADVSWIHITVPSGGPRLGYPSFTFAVDANPAAGMRRGHVTVDTAVYDIVQAGTISAAPIGVLDTPVNNAMNLYGSIAVTGWALDDLEVTEVQVWRDPHPSDPASAVYSGPAPQGGKVFVGYAAIVSGARPDVESLFPAYPFNNRAGWGYLMLTRGLIWDGKGNFKLHAIAADREGHLSLLGSTTISINNAASTKPFGAIDTPVQGDTVSGMYANTGWVLTPNAGATIPAGNVRVAIDGVFLTGTPSMSDRADISAGFSQFNTSGAGRGLFIDTSRYPDGVHTIAWLVTDSTGSADGLGGRFFTVANQTSALRSGEREPAAGEIDALPLDAAALRARSGWDRDAELTWHEADRDGRVAIDARELGRVEVRLDEAASAQWRGYLRVNGTLRSLPAGSHLAADGMFTWQPAVGFVGAYDFAFVRSDGRGQAARREVRITVKPGA